MIHTRSKIVTSLAAALVIGAAVVPSASVADDASPGASGRTATELGQAVGEPRDGDSAFARTATELGQSTDPSPPVTASNESSRRTATELGQSTGLSPSPAPSDESGGLDWNDVAIVGGVLGLVAIGIGGMVLFTRRRGTVRKARTPVASG
jgi:hypothetical protein